MLGGLGALTVKSQQFEYEDEDRFAEDEDEFAPQVTISFFRGCPRGGLACVFSLTAFKRSTLATRPH